MAYQSQFDTTGMSQQALDAWQRFEQATGQGWGINSAYRDPERNKAAGGASKSQHMNGNAFDVDVSALSTDERNELIRKARAAGFGGVGVYNNALHFDVAGERNWGPDFKSGSTPSWALETLQGAHTANDGHDHGSPQAQQIGNDTMAALGMPQNNPQQPSYGGAAANNGYQAAMMQPQVSTGLQQPQNALAQMQPPRYENALNVADFLRPIQANALTRRMT